MRISFQGRAKTRDGLPRLRRTSQHEPPTLRRVGYRTINPVSLLIQPPQVLPECPGRRNGNPTRNSTDGERVTISGTKEGRVKVSVDTCKQEVSNWKEGRTSP